jgi:DNA-binding MarR family transcriptional regulator
VNIELAIKQSKFKSEHQKLAVNIMYTSGWLSSLHLQVLKPFGISTQQFNVLRILRGQKGTPLSINCLIERMIDKKSNASRIVDKLEEKTLVVRSICPDDRRQVEVRITPKGLELINSLDIHTEQFHSTLEALSEEEAYTVNTLLDKMRIHHSNHIKQ